MLLCYKLGFQNLLQFNIYEDTKSLLEYKEILCYKFNILISSFEFPKVKHAHLKDRTCVASKTILFMEMVLETIAEDIDKGNHSFFQQFHFFLQDFWVFILLLKLFFHILSGFLLLVLGIPSLNLTSVQSLFPF